MKKIKINKHIILEEVSNLNSFLVYHISPRLYKTIKPLKFQSKENQDKFKKNFNSSEKYFKKYSTEISAFMGPVTKENIELLKNKGFKPYMNSNKLYLNVIDLNDPENKNSINYLKIHSIKEEKDYNDKYWKQFITKTNHLSDSKFFEKKEEYKNKLKQYLKNKGITSEANTPREIKQQQNYRDWANTDKWFKFNSKYGSKQQYASYIPHLAISVKKPLKIKEVREII